MLEVAQAVDDGDGGVRGHLGHRAVLEGAEHDAVHPALEVARDVGQALAGAQPRARLVDEERAAAELLDPHFEGHPRAQRGLFENQRQVLARQRRVELLGALLHQPRQLQQPFRLGRRELLEGEEVRVREPGQRA